MSRNRHKRIAVPNPSPRLEIIADKLEERIPTKVVHSHLADGSIHHMEKEMELRTQPIAIGFPMDELMFSKFMVNFTALNWMPWDPIITTQSTYLPDARNTIHNMFLEKSEASHLLMLDSDVLPPPHLIETLLRHNKDVVGGYYRKKEKYAVKDLNGNVTIIQRPVVYDYAQDNEKGIPMYVARFEPGKGLESVDAMGAGCWMMSRQLAQALGKSPYDMNSGGEDMVICKKIRSLGFEIWVD